MSGSGGNGVQPDQRYSARVTDARMTESMSGTPGIWVKFETPDGDISRTIYLTPATREHAQKSLNNMGIDSDRLASDEFWQDPAQFLVNATCEITTAEEEYEGKSRVVVQWINRAITQASDAAKRRAASLFQRVPEPQPIGASSNGRPAPAFDADVPF